MSIECHLGLRGRFKLEVVNSEGEITKKLDWFDNLITNHGLDLFSGLVAGAEHSQIFNGVLDRCSVGTSSATPAVTDGALGAEVGGTTSIFAQASSIDTPGRYLSFQVTYTFAVGTATGNLSELGIGQNVSHLFSRALIKDGAGNPTTITVLADESLRVSYELRVSQTVLDYNVVVDGYTFVIRAANIDSSTGNASAWGSRTAKEVGNVMFYDGAIGALTARPAGASSGASLTDAASYTLGSYTLTGALNATTANANFSISALAWTMGPGSWQASISPVIVKDDTKVVDIGVRLTWGRDGEL